MQPTSKPILIVLIAAIGALALFPIVGEGYYAELVVRLMILGIFAMSLDFLIGYTGLVSFGHAAFFGLTGYILAILTPDSGPITFWYALPICLGVSAFAALVIGWFSVRTTGIYFIMITLAFAQMLFYYFNENTELGGSDGIFIFYRPEMRFGEWTLLDINDAHVFYYLVLGSLVGAYVLLSIILRAPFGQVIQGIKANEARTKALGYATVRYKLVSFVIAGTLAGFAGFLEAVHTGIVSPGHLGWHESGNAMMIVILGGMGTLYGAVIGAFTFGFLQDSLQELSEHWHLWFGLFVIFVVLFLPHGIAGLLRNLSERLRGKQPVAAKPGTAGEGEQ